MIESPFSNPNYIRGLDLLPVCVNVGYRQYTVLFFRIWCKQYGFLNELTEVSYEIYQSQKPPEVLMYGAVLTVFFEQDEFPATSSHQGSGAPCSVVH